MKKRFGEQMRVFSSCLNVSVHSRWSDSECYHDSLTFPRLYDRVLWQMLKLAFAAEASNRITDLIMAG